MGTQRILVVGATGRTGGAIVDGLLEAGETNVEALVRPTSRMSSILRLKERGLKVHVAEIKDSTKLAEVLVGIHTVISAIGPGAQFEQIPLADASKRANVKLFIPCAFITVCPPGGVMWIRDQKEQTYQYIQKIGLSFTIIDVGYWYQASFPTLLSGRVDYASLVVPNVTISGDGNLKTALTDLRDIGPYVATIITDSRTVNKYVFCYGDLLSQEEIFAMLESLSGEPIERQYIGQNQLLSLLETARKTFSYDLSDMQQALTLISLEYSYSKFVCGHNCPEYAKSLGYLDARDLYPNFIPRSFEAFAKELLDGRAAKIYEGMSMQA